MWAKPRAAPPPSASPITGGLGATAAGGIGKAGAGGGVWHPANAAPNPSNAAMRRLETPAAITAGRP